MTESTSSLPNLDALTGADIQTVTFGSAKAFGRGYDTHEVDSFVGRCAAAIDHLRNRLRGYEDEIFGLRERIDRDSRSNEVAHAISVLSQAQQTADNTVAQADGYSARVMSEARDLYEDARRNAAILEQETEDKARQVYEDALGCATALEQETQDRVAELTRTAVTAQKELDSQTAYLLTLRDATRTEIEFFLEGLLDHVTYEYGRAHPMAANAAINSTPRGLRRSNRLAGRSAQAAGAETPPMPSPQSAPNDTNDTNDENDRAANGYLGDGHLGTRLPT